DGLPVAVRAGLRQRRAEAGRRQCLPRRQLRRRHRDLLRRRAGDAGAATGPGGVAGTGAGRRAEARNPAQPASSARRQQQGGAQAGQTQDDVGPEAGAMNSRVALAGAPARSAAAWLRWLVVLALLGVIAAFARTGAVSPR